MVVCDCVWWCVIVCGKVWRYSVVGGGVQLRVVVYCGVC